MSGLSFLPATSSAYGCRRKLFHPIVACSQTALLLRLGRAFHEIFKPSEALYSIISERLTRWVLQDVLMDVWKRTEITAVCVTHDVDEAILLADRVVMMSNGPNAKIGNIMDVDLERPRTRKSLLNHLDYYAYREELLEFLEAYISA